jgi:hypothetical protein
MFLEEEKKIDIYLFIYFIFRVSQTFCCFD